MRIGIDFDNTIAGYDHLFLAAAQERGLLPADFRGAKKTVRDTLRAMPEGELRWTELQGLVYGARMDEARMIEGVDRFLLECRHRQIPVAIVSHKTRFAARDPQMVDLHEASRRWLTAQGFFDRLGVAPAAVFFEPSRTDKCRRIGALGVTHFIDDLEEVFLEPDFPAGVARYLLCDEPHGDARADYTRCRSWPDIQRAIFADRTA